MITLDKVSPMTILFNKQEDLLLEFYLTMTQITYKLNLYSTRKNKGGDFPFDLYQNLDEKVTEGILISLNFVLM